MKQYCTYYKDYKGLRLPKCNCIGCWSKYFNVNRSEARAALTILKSFGGAQLEALKGTKYVSFLKLLYVEELENDRTSTT